MNIELKTCPYCGKKPKYETFHDGFIRWHRIECKNCNIIMDKNTRKEIADTWNKRV
jgi:Lar family restriction alleviation protein